MKTIKTAVLNFHSAPRSPTAKIYRIRTYIDAPANIDIVLQSVLFFKDQPAEYVLLFSPALTPCNLMNITKITSAHLLLRAEQIF